MDSIYNTTIGDYITAEFCVEEIHKVQNIIYAELRYFDINGISKFSFNGRLKHAIGRTRRTSGIYSIELSTAFASVASLEKIKEVLAHECVHLIPGCFDHGTKFKRVAYELKPYGYTITRTTTDEAYIKLRREEKASKGLYMPHCLDCGKYMTGNINFTSKLKFIVKGNEGGTRYYTCPYCDSRKLNVIKRFGDGTEFEVTKDMLGKLLMEHKEIKITL